MGNVQHSMVWHFRQS